MKKHVFAVVFFMLFSGIVYPDTLTNPVFADQFGLKAVGECGFVSLSWNNVKGADTYWIYRGPGKGKEYLTPLTDFPIRSTSFTDDINIKNGQEYCYFLTAVDSGAKEISKSAEACATPKCEEIRQEPTCKLVLKYQIDNTSYWVNDDSKGPMETSPVIVNSRMFLVIRYVTSEIEGTNLEWVAAEKKVKIKTRKGGIIELWIGKKDARIDGKTIQIDPNNPKVVPVIKDGRTLLPMRFVGENLGATGADGIKWFESTKTVEIRVDDPVCEKEGFRYPNAIQLKENYYEFSVEYHTGKNQFPQEVSLGLARSDNTKVLRLGKSKRDNASSEDLLQVKTPEAKTEDVKTSFGKAKRYLFRLAIEPGVLHFYKFISSIETLPKEGYLGPVSAPLPNAIKIDDFDIKKFDEGNSMRLQGYFTNEPYPMIVDDYWKIFERGGKASKKIMVRLEQGQIIEDGTFICIEGQKKTTQKGMPTITANKIIMSQKIVQKKPRISEIEYTRPPLSSICDGKYAIVFSGALDNAKVKDEEEVEHVYRRLRGDFVGGALNSYKTLFNLGLCKKNIYMCFGRGDEEIDQICADDGDGNPFDFDWDDSEYRATMENDAQVWWRAGDGWSVKKGSEAALEESVNSIQEKIDALPDDITPEIYIMIGTHGNVDVIGAYNGYGIYYPTIIDHIKNFIANSNPSLHARSKIRFLLDTCHAGSIIDNMENSFKTNGYNYIQLAASCKGDELGWGTRPNHSETSYAGAGGTFGIPFLESVNTQAKSSSDKKADWKVAYDYALQNDIHVSGAEHEQPDGSFVIVYTHPQYWYSRDMSMFYAGPAFEDLSMVNPEVRATMCIIGADMTNAQLDICNCSKDYGDVYDYPKASFRIVNDGVFTFTVESITADETVIQKRTRENVLLFSDSEQYSCIRDFAPFRSVQVKPGESITCYVCAHYYYMSAQPLDSNGYMATEGGMPAFIQVPISIRYYLSYTDKQTLRTSLRLRVEGDGFEAKYNVSTSRSSSIKKGFEMNWESSPALVTFSPKPEGTAPDLLACPNFKGDVDMHVKTDVFSVMPDKNTVYGYIKSLKIDIPMEKVVGLSCNSYDNWGWARINEDTSKLKDKVTFIAPTYGNRHNNKIKGVSLIITPGVLSKDGFRTFLGKHTFNIFIYRDAKYFCNEDLDSATIILKLTVEFVQPVLNNGG